MPRYARHDRKPWKTVIPSAAEGSLARCKRQNWGKSLREHLDTSVTTASREKFTSLRMILNVNHLVIFALGRLRKIDFQVEFP
jgi:hypothetical protein